MIELSDDGKLLRTFSVMRLLKDNGYVGLLYMSSIDDKNTAPCCDFLHTNDRGGVPNRMQEDLFKHGDVMISVRNINTVLVFDPATGKIKHMMIGHTVRQHDPTSWTARPSACSTTTTSRSRSTRRRAAS